MPTVEMTIDLDAIWTRYHADETTPDDVRRLLLAYDGASAHLSQTLAALTAERAARRAFEADAAQLRQAALAYTTSVTIEERTRLRAELYVLAKVDHPGRMLVATITQLQRAWDKLSDCVNEFEPEYPDSYGEYRDALDTAILAVLATQTKGVL